MYRLPPWRKFWMQHGHQVRYWSFWRDLVWAVLFGLLFAATSFRVVADDDLNEKVARLERQVSMAEANLIGCFNGSFTGVYYFTRRNERVDIVCDSPAFEIKSSPE